MVSWFQLYEDFWIHDDEADAPILILILILSTFSWLLIHNYVSSFISGCSLMCVLLTYCYCSYSPNIKEIKVVKHRKVRRARLYYLRDKLPRLSTFKWSNPIAPALSLFWPSRQFLQTWHVVTLVETKCPWFFLLSHYIHSCRPFFFFNFLSTVQIYFIVFSLSHTKKLGIKSGPVKKLHNLDLISLSFS